MAFYTIISAMLIGTTLVPADWVASYLVGIGAAGFPLTLAAIFRWPNILSKVMGAQFVNGMALVALLFVPDLRTNPSQSVFAIGSFLTLSKWFFGCDVCNK